MPKYSAYKALYFGTPNRAMDQLLFKQFLKLPSPSFWPLVIRASTLSEMSVEALGPRGFVK